MNTKLSNNHIKLRLLLTVSFVSCAALVLFGLGFQSYVSAVTLNNFDNIPHKQVEKLRDRLNQKYVIQPDGEYYPYAQSGAGSGAQCKSGISHFQNDFIGATDDVHKDVIQINENQLNDVRVSIYRMYGFCESFFDNIPWPGGSVNDPSKLRQTDSMITGLSVASDIPGSPYPLSSWSIIGGGSPITTPYEAARNGNYRIVKNGGSNGPLYKTDLSLDLSSAADDMQPGVEYTITVWPTIKSINTFDNRNPPNYLCVVEGAPVSSSTDFRNCEAYTADPIEFKLKIVNLSTATCTIQGSTGSIFPGEPFTVKMVVKNTGSQAWNSSYKMKDIIGNSHDVNFDSYPVNPGDTQTMYTSITPPAVTSPNGQTFTYNWQAVNDSGKTFGEDCPVTVNVVPRANLPYIRAINNDVWTGAYFANDSDGFCSYTQSTPTTNNNPWQAAYVTRGFDLNNASGSDYGTFSTGGNLIVPQWHLGFYGHNGTTYSNVSDSSTLTLNSLVFANKSDAGAAVASPFTSAPLCLPDYYQTTKDNLTPADVITDYPANPANNPSTRIASASGDTVLDYGNSNVSINSATTVPLGARVTLITTGDITINANITKTPSAWSSPSSLRLITKGGNINITSQADTIEASLIAQTVATTINTINTTKGIVDSCSDLEGSLATREDITPINSRCNKKLTIKGQVLAQGLKLQRLYGSLDANTILTGANAPCVSDSKADKLNSCAAELIQFDPSLYLRPSLSQPDDAIDMAQSMQELPPIY